MPDMTDPQNLVVINEKITSLRKTTDFLEARTADFPALYRNIRRVSASVKMLELNLTDALMLDQVLDQTLDQMPDPVDGQGI